MKTVSRAVMTVVYAAAACSFPIAAQWPAALFVLIPVFLAVNLLAGVPYGAVKQTRLRICVHGADSLVIFLGSTALAVLCHVVMAVWMLPQQWQNYLWSVLVCVLVEAALFWNGMICIYCASVQLGLKMRIIGGICGMIPVVNQIVLGKMLRIVYTEIRFETEKAELNEKRQKDRICATKYPILLVHGVFFRDFKLINYWGRIPGELEKNGAEVYYGQHQSARPVRQSGLELARRIEEITRQTGCEKVNIIAHSKGGLDCRCAMQDPAVAARVASLTTINTPHRGCEFADYLLHKIPSNVQQKVAAAYNKAAAALGDEDPDFLAAVGDLTASACQQLNAEMADPPEEILCQSVGSIMRRASYGKFPMRHSFHIVSHFDGPNDGLVGGRSFRWGQRHTLLTTQGDRGISHGDMIDMNRENIADFDVREFYVQLVAQLKEMGL